VSDTGSVTSYASVGLRLWGQFNTSHGHRCPCLICADTRAYLLKPALVPNPYRVMVVPDDEWGPDSATQRMERGPA
jgi:hypothetical protein